MIRTCNKQVKLDDDRVQARHASVLYNKAASSTGTHHVFGSPARACGCR